MFLIARRNPFPCFHLFLHVVTYSFIAHAGAQEWAGEFFAQLLYLGQVDITLFSYGLSVRPYFGPILFAYCPLHNTFSNLHVGGASYLEESLPA